MTATKTKTFAGRADATKLAYAESYCQQHFNMSYGQYCSSSLLDIACNDALPEPEVPKSLIEKRKEIFALLHEMSERIADTPLAAMTDDEIKDLIASRYA